MFQIKLSLMKLNYLYVISNALVLVLIALVHQHLHMIDHLLHLTLPLTNVKVRNMVPNLHQNVLKGSCFVNIIPIQQHITPKIVVILARLHQHKQTRSKPPSLLHWRYLNLQNPRIHLKYNVMVVVNMVIINQIAPTRINGLKITMVVIVTRSTLKHVLLQYHGTLLFQLKSDGTGRTRLLLPRVVHYRVPLPGCTSPHFHMVYSSLYIIIFLILLLILVHLIVLLISK